jgi:basic membrane protein A
MPFSDNYLNISSQNKKEKIMKHRSIYVMLAILMVGIMTLAACAPAATPTEAPVPPTEAPPAPTEAPTAVPTETPPCLIIGALYGGAVTDAGYNQAFHDSVQKIKQNIPCVQIIEAENVPDEAGATTTMENMIKQGAKMIIATAFNHQYPALDLSKKYPDVIFEHAGGWEMGPNFANFFGDPVNAWYLMGAAAAKMSESKNLGFVAAFPLGWTLTFANAFELGAQSVDPNIKTNVAYTFAWGDSAKEAEATNSLINNGADVITMHVDSPATVIGTAESRGVKTIGFQSLAAQQFAPENWITGTGYDLGDKLTWLTSTVLDKTWKPIFLRCGMPDNCVLVAPFGPKVPQDVQDYVNQLKADLNDGKIVPFAGPIYDQNGNVKVKKGEVLSSDVMSNVDWFVKGINGSPK